MNNLKNIKRFNKSIIVLSLGLALSACGGSSDDKVVEVIEDIVNSAPTISSSAVTTIESGTAYSYALVSADADGDTLTMTAANLPAWLTFDSATGILSGTPADTDEGDTAITLTVSDGTDEITQSFTVSVTVPVPPNNAAVITSTGVTSATVGEAYSYTLMATDADSDTLTMSATIPAALSWLTFDDTTGVLSGTPASGDVAATEITLTVNDGTEDSVQTFTITVEEMAVESDELLINGDFENGSTSWNDVGTIVAGDNSYFEADVQAAGNPWDVSLNQVMTLVPNTTYTFSFKAKASVARTMIAGLGLNYDPWDSVTETVSLTTEWTTYTYTMTTPFGDDNNRVIFDMGAEVGVVSIDDVSVTVDDTVTETPNAELLTNAGFDNGFENWNEVGTIIEGDNNYFEADVQAAGNPWDVSLNQVLTLVPNTTYTFSFKAKASLARTMIAGLGLNYDPWDSVTETVSLTTEWTTYTYTMTTPFGDNNNRVIFDMGAEVGVVSIDDVSVKVSSAAEPAGPTVGIADIGDTGLVVNGGFELGNLDIWGGISDLISVEMDDLGTYLAKVVAPEAQSPGIKQSKIGEGIITAGQALTVSFDMKGITAGDGGVVNALLFTEASTGVSKTETLFSGVPSADWSSHTFDVTAGADTEWGVALLLQSACGAVAGCKVTAYFDNVKIVAK
jgi:hypothetical protein